MGGYAGLCVLVSSISIVLNLWLNATPGKFIFPYNRLVSDSHALLAVATAVTSFMFFKNLKIPYSKFVNTAGASTFGVLLIHANSDTMRRWLWRDVVDCAGHYDNEFFGVYAVGCVLAIFTVCILIDWIRIHTVEKWIFNLLSKKLGI